MEHKDEHFNSAVFDTPNRTHAYGLPVAAHLLCITNETGRQLIYKTVINQNEMNSTPLGGGGEDGGMATIAAPSSAAVIHAPNQIHRSIKNETGRKKISLRDAVIELNSRERL